MRFNWVSNGQCGPRKNSIGHQNNKQKHVCTCNNHKIINHIPIDFVLVKVSPLQVLFHRKKTSRLHSPGLHVQRLASTSFLFDSHFTGYFGHQNAQLYYWRWGEVVHPQLKSTQTTSPRLPKTESEELWLDPQKTYSKDQTSADIWNTRFWTSKSLPLPWKNLDHQIEPPPPNLPGQALLATAAEGAMSATSNVGQFVGEFSGVNSEEVQKLLIWSDIVDYPCRSCRSCVGVLHTYIQIHIISK